MACPYNSCKSVANTPPLHVCPCPSQVAELEEERVRAEEERRRAELEEKRRKLDEEAAKQVGGCGGGRG